MKLTNKEMVIEALERIEILHTHISNVMQAQSHIMHIRPGKEVSYGNLYTVLMEEEMHEWRSVVMWGLTLDDKDRDRIKAAVHNRFLNDKMHIAHWLNNGITPSRWLSADEEEFRAMVRKAFAPKGEGG